MSDIQLKEVEPEPPVKQFWNTQNIILVAVGIALVLIVIIILILYFLKKKKSQNVGVDEPDLDLTKIQTLGNQYNISSIGNIPDDYTPNRNLSLISDRKLSEISNRENESLLKSNAQDDNSTPGVIRQQSVISTYIEFEKNSQQESRKPSYSSQNIPMKELAIKNKFINTAAPLAKGESLGSLGNSQCSLQKRKETNFIPKIPMKKKDVVYRRSVADLSPRENGSPFKVLSSKSEANLFNDGENIPNLPPKIRPLLPPKQRINKNKSELAKIEKELKQSLTELRKTHEFQDYDDLPEEKVPQPSPPKEKSDISHEFLDYDDPPIHYNDNIEDYDDPPIQYNTGKVNQTNCENNNNNIM